MIEFQRLILGDALRNEKFTAALRRLIKPGKTTVADLGAGTGYLSFVARKLGAKHAWLVEMSELIALAQQLAKKNKVGGLTFVHAHSVELGEPPQVDLVVSETLGNLAFEENLLETMQDARRWLAPGGTIVPQRVRQVAAPLVAPRFFAELDVFSRLGHGLDFGAARALATDNVYVRRFAPGDLLASQVIDAVDLREETASVRRGRAEWKLAKATNLHGFALWWECELIADEPELLLSTSPHAPPTHWEQIWLPPHAPMAAKAGDTLRLDFECDSRPEVKINLKWKATLIDRAGKVRSKESHDMQKGYLE